MLQESYLLDYPPPGSGVHAVAKLVRVEGDLKAWCRKNKLNPRKLMATARLLARTEGERHKGYRLLTQSDKYGEVINDYEGYQDTPASKTRKPYCPATYTKLYFAYKDSLDD